MQSGKQLNIKVQNVFFAAAFPGLPKPSRLQRAVAKRAFFRWKIENGME